MKNLLLLSGSSLLLLTVSCTTSSEPPEDVTATVSKDGSIETVLSVTHADSFDVLTTHHKIWVKGNLDKTIETHDTLKKLGTTMQEGTDASGNPQAAMAPQDYEFYITVQ